MTKIITVLMLCSLLTVFGADGPLTIDTSNAKASVTSYLSQGESPLPVTANNSVEFFYMGDGEIVRMKYQQPGHVLSGVTGAQLTREGQARMEQLLAESPKWAGQIPSLRQQLQGVTSVQEVQRITLPSGVVEVTDSSLAVVPEAEELIAIFERCMPE